MSEMMARILKSMREMEGYTKDNHVAYGQKKYDYEDYSQVAAIVLNALEANGLAFRQYKSAEEGKDVLFTVVYDIDTGEREVMDTRSLFILEDPQAAGSAETYAKRYALKTAFRLAEADDDGETAHRAAQGKKGPQRGSQKPAADPWAHVKTLMDEAAELGCKRDGIKASFENYKTEQGYDIKAIEAHVEQLIHDQRMLRG